MVRQSEVVKSFFRYIFCFLKVDYLTRSSQYLANWAFARTPISVVDAVKAAMRGGASVYLFFIHAISTLQAKKGQS